MHQSQIDFIKRVKTVYPKHFTACVVVDIGSMDINGNNRSHFTYCHYRGIDIGEGPNVDIVCKAHELIKEYPHFDNMANTVISTEMLEHDKHWRKSLRAMYDILIRGGLLVLTAASSARSEHGTTRTSPESSPFTNDYYKNITFDMLNDVFKDLPHEFLDIEVYDNGRDIGLILVK